MAFDRFKRKVGAEKVYKKVDAAMENSPTGIEKKVKGADVFLSPKADKMKRKIQDHFSK